MREKLQEIIPDIRTEDWSAEKIGLEDNSVDVRLMKGRAGEGRGMLQIVMILKRARYWDVIHHIYCTGPAPCKRSSKDL